MNNKTLTITKTQKKGYGPELQIDLDGTECTLNHTLSQDLTDTLDETAKGIFSDGLINFYRDNGSKVQVQFTDALDKNNPIVLVQQIVERVRMVKDAFDAAYPEEVITATHTFS